MSSGQVFYRLVKQDIVFLAYYCIIVRSTHEIDGVSHDRAGESCQVVKFFVA